MLHYIVQLFTFQLLFLVVYDLFLKKETFFQYNRWYLLSTTVLSFLVPFLKIGALRQAIPQEYLVQLPAVVIGKTQPVASSAISEAFISSISMYTIVGYVWVFGALVAAAFFVYKLIKVMRLTSLGTTLLLDKTKVVLLPKSDTAFSFLNTIYLGDQLSDKQQNDILLHEKIHIQQRHSLDLLVFELFIIVFWFNPLLYIYQKRMETLHEYIADRGVALQTQNVSYYQTLLEHVFQTESISFINTFFNHSLIKNRIIMLQKSKSNRMAQLKYLVLVPLVFGMLVYTSCSSEADTAASETAALTSDTEVMRKIVELSEAIMKKGNISDEEVRALEFLATEAKPGDKIYSSVQEYLDETENTIEVVEYQMGADIPFSVIEYAPLFPGCDPASSNKERKICFSRSLSTKVSEAFDVKIGDNLGLVGDVAIYTQFAIDKTGRITDVKARAPHPDLKNEAIRVLESLPQMTPGEHDGKKVAVLYSLPIKFKIRE